MNRALAVTIVSFVLAAAAASCAPAEDERPTPRSTTATPRDFVLAVAGDIAAEPCCSARYRNAAATGAVVAAVNPDVAMTAGDNAYGEGSATQYATQYDPTWGDFKGRTKPVPGNHEYRTAGAAGYFSYFEEQLAGEENEGAYYAFDAGRYWRVYALNCEVPCGAGSAQAAWVKADLAAHRGKHYLAVVHRPLHTSSSSHGPYTALSTIWSLLQQAGADLFVAGHNHHYERFGKLDAAGTPAPTGLRQFVAGAGGTGMYGFDAAPATGSEKRNATTYGVLKLVLSVNSYRWEYLSAGRKWTGSAHVDDAANPRGSVLDSGTQATNTVASPCTIVGTEANDRLTGTAGDDTICGLGGNDVIAGSGGDDTIVGGAGCDTADFGRAGSKVTADLRTGTASGAGNDLLIGVESLRGSAYNDDLRGNAGRNTLTGGSGRDRLDGHRGDDALSGEAGDDTLVPRSGADTVTGGDGSDLVRFASAVSVDLTAGTAAGEGQDRLSGVERVYGSQRADTLRGSPGQDALRGLGGNDTLLGESSADRLYGDGGDDRLLGGWGTDTCDGGPGTDSASSCERALSVP